MSESISATANRAMRSVLAEEGWTPPSNWIEGLPEQSGLYWVRDNQEVYILSWRILPSFVETLHAFADHKVKVNTITHHAPVAPPPPGGGKRTDGF